jgi:uncharacterized protein DUF3592
LYHVGEAVTVLYRPDVPSSAIIERGVGRNWLPAVALYVLGSLFSVVGIKWIIAPRASAPTVERTGP